MAWGLSEEEIKKHKIKEIDLKKEIEERIKVEQSIEEFYDSMKKKGISEDTIKGVILRLYDGGKIK